MKLQHPLMLSLLASALAFSTPTFADDAAAASAYVKPHITHDQFGKMNVVVALTNEMVLPMKLRNIANSLKAVDTWGGKLNVKVVMYAKGLAWLKAPTDDQKAQLDNLRSHGVQFMVCNNTLMEQGIDYHSLYGVKESDIVPSGFAEVAFLQARKHYVVDPSM
ncbi:MAG: DsrE family protein [Betaproteobacteria bacterium]|nr:DsrE family protein [Betaproteobacteria bacterium]